MKQFYYLFVLVIVLSACDAPSTTEKTADSIQSTATTPQKDIGHLTTDAANALMRESTPEILAYEQAIADMLATDLPILTLNAQPQPSLSLNDPGLVAEKLALRNRSFRKFSHHIQNKQALRSEVMLSRRALPGDFRKNQAAHCAKTACYRVDMYNYFYNLTSTAIVDITAKRVVSVDHLANTQPDLNARLKQLALAIANHSPDVIERLGAAHGDLQPTMVEIKTALKGSRCERSKHLCVAPTYVVGNRALWAIVDLTDLKLVGLRWSELGTSGPPVIVTERTLENRYVFNEFCEKTNHYASNDWSFDYNITSSDGMHLTDVKFKNKATIDSVKLVDWHVSYSHQDNFGYSDAIGCPVFSSAVVVAHQGPKQETITHEGKQIGFAFIQDFRQLPWPAPCNYRYEQRFEFYNDGRFRIAFADYGRGCGTDGTYRPVARIDLAQDATAPFEIAHYSDGQWETWDQERWTQQDDIGALESQYSHRIADKHGEGFYLAPSNGQFSDKGRGDHAYIYATVNHPDRDEGERDLSTLGSCCNKDYQQGPELFMQPAESLVEQDWILWYVAQIKNDGAAGSEYCWADTEVVNGSPKIKVWPCFAGPMFVPIKP